MKTKEFKTSWVIIIVFLGIIVLQPVNLLAEQPSDIQETIKGQGKERPEPPRKRDVEKVGSIFDDQADEFEEPTYTPPADIEEKIKSIPSIPSNIMKYLKDKHNVKDVTARLQQTSNGPSGSVYFRGDINPKTAEGVPLKSVIAETGRKDRARAISKAIIAEEVSLLGITDMAEIKEVNSLDRPEGVSIYFNRYIGDLPFEHGEISVHFKADGETIMSLQANVVAPPPALYQAASTKTLGRGKIFRIISQELKTAAGGTDVGVGIASAKKVAIPNPPYVVWKVGVSTGEGDWDYKMDAFTGEILEKISATILFKPRR